MTGRGAERRGQIVAATVEVVAEHGYARTSVRRVADRVGVAMSVVLHHFGSKDELVHAVVDRLYRLALDAVAPAVRAEPTAAGRLRAYVRARTAFVAAYPTEHAALLDLGSSYRSESGRRLDELTPDPGLADDLAALDVAAMLRAGVASGEFRALDPAAVAVAVQGAVDAAVLARAHDPDFDLTAYGEEVVTLIDLATRNTGTTGKEERS